MQRVRDAAWWRLVRATPWFLLVSGCSTLSQSVVADPEVQVENLHLRQLDFNQATLALELRVQNPNRVGATLAGYDYVVKIDGEEFLRGEEAQSIHIGAQTSTVVRVPVTLTFSEVYKTFRALHNKEQFRYELDCGLKFALPVLGTRRLPISKSGTLPVVKAPTIDLSSLSLARAGVLDQELLLRMKVYNPNSFGLTVHGLDYDLTVNGRRWARGKSSAPIVVKPAADNEIALPVSVDILSAGAALAELVGSGKPVRYALKGSADVATTLPELKRVQVPFVRTGTIELGR